MSKTLSILPLALMTVLVSAADGTPNSDNRTAEGNPAANQQNDNRQNDNRQNDNRQFDNRQGENRQFDNRQANDVSAQRQFDSRPTNDQNGQPNQPDQAGERVKDGHENLTYRQRMITGKIADVKEAEVTAEGKKENHFLVKVTTHDNHTVVVDLGARNTLKGDFKAGDEIAAFGITGRLNQRPLIVASKIATIVPIEGREEIFESVPVNNNQQGENDANSNRRFSQEAFERSNSNAIGTQRQEAPPSFLTNGGDCGCR